MTAKNTFGFFDSDVLRAWYRIHDGVMGGCSRIQVSDAPAERGGG